MSSSTSNLVKKLKECGIKTTFKRLVGRFGLPKLRKRVQSLQEFVDANLLTTDMVYSEENIADANKEFDGFICGSDQIWNPANTSLDSIEPLFQEEIIPLNRTWIVQTFVSKVVLNMMWIKCTKLSLVDVDADYSMYGRLNMAEDQLQSAALFENVNNVFYYNKPLYLYRDNGDSITRKQTPKLLIDSLKAKSRVMDMLRQLQVEENIYDKFFENYYRTLNHYIVKNISTFENYKSYKTFVSEAQSYDVGGLYAAKSIDKLVYRILYSNNYSAIRVLGCIYNLIKNK